jgi:hypothetical protein
MAQEIHYHPTNHWERTTAGVNGRVVEVEQQEVWEQLEADEWLHVTLRRPATGFHRSAYVAEVMLRRGHRSDGGWTSAHTITPTRYVPVADPTTRASPAPRPPAPPEHAGAQHIRRTEYGVPRSEKKPPARKRYTLKAVTK